MVVPVLIDQLPVLRIGEEMPCQRPHEYSQQCHRKRER